MMKLSINKIGELANAGSLSLCYTKLMLDLNEYGIEMWPEEKIQAFRKALLDWYDDNKRDLPWRRTRGGWAKSLAPLIRVRVNISAQWLIGRFDGLPLRGKLWIITDKKNFSNY